MTKPQDQNALRLLFAASVTVFVTTLAFSALPSNAATPRGCLPNTRAPCYARIDLGHGDWVLNYDNTSTQLNRHNADWPVTLFFYDNAEVDKIKRKLNPPFWIRGSKMNLKLKDRPNGKQWDQDGGMKWELVNRCSSVAHYRVYADGNDRIYNTRWDYMVVATTHIDKGEYFCGAKFGWSERVERAIGYLMNQKRCCLAVHNHRGWQNREPRRREGNHIWKSNGKVTYVWVR